MNQSGRSQRLPRKEAGATFPIIGGGRHEAANG